MAGLQFLLSSGAQFELTAIFTKLVPRVKRLSYISTCFCCCQVINVRLGNGNGCVIVRVAPHFVFTQQQLVARQSVSNFRGQTQKATTQMLSRKMQQQNALITHTRCTQPATSARRICSYLMRHSMHLQPCACQYSAVDSQNDICHPFCAL